VRIERHANRAIANGMDVNLEAFPIEARDKPGEPLRLEIELATGAAMRAITSRISS